jgi:hypothetical protein
MTAPRLRSLDSIVVPEGASRVVVLRDTEGIAPGPVTLSLEAARIASRFDGRRSLERVAREAAVDVAWVEQLVAELDAALLLDTPAFRARRAEVVRAFGAAKTRPAAHAGGAYDDDPVALRRYIDRACLGAAPARARPGKLRGLIAPHMDLWRAAVGYGHAYRAVADGLADEVDTFFLLGTSHAAMARPFAVCDKAFDTPLGALEPDSAAIDELARASHFDVHADAYLHKGEHSLEFQAVFLAHALGGRRARIVPVLCGLGEVQLTRRDPARDAAAESFLEALGDLARRYGDRAVVVAGADLAHVGPRFGDPRPLDPRARRALADTDGASIDRVVEGDARGFFHDVTADLHVRRVCGVGPVYTALRALGGTAGELLHYDQCVDPQEGSVVTHASIAFWR